MDTYAVAPRTVVGKRVATLRREGLLPANIFGRHLESVAVQLPVRTARELLVAHGTDTLVQLQVEGEGSPRPVVVRSFQRHPVNRQVLHLDFYQVDLTRPIQGAVPIRLTGEAPAVHVYQGILLTGADSIQVEALPADIPESIEVSIESLRRPESVITVGSLKLPASVRVLTDPDTMIARIGRTRLRPEAEADILEGEEPEAAEEGADASSDEPAD
ncbi:MAG: 50S ribosomal protein L25 [Dehalococcoidia bacterium]|nr:50S ribosomal protein L25 [Dehalococcoidia bacterium]